MGHYTSHYFEWQRKVGVFGGEAELFKFKGYIKTSDNVIDFGCGGGFVLKSLKCAGKKGIEINESAREYAEKENGLKVVADIDEIEDSWADVVISNHALEHTYDPLNILIRLSDKLKKGGIIIIVVPQEFKDKYYREDINQHLFTWTPLALGNLFNAAGFKVISSKTLINKWPPAYRLIYKVFGKYIFNLTSFIYCIVSGSGYQVITIGEKQ
jgi:SAM-dependent methyltransferase